MGDRLMSNAAFGLVDWGTTHLRLWLVDARGNVLAHAQSADGMGGLTPDQFETVLETLLGKFGMPNDLPVAICGMAGSRQGWREAPYANIPVTLDALRDQGAAFISGKRRIHIISGIANRSAHSPDVMRGEETQLLGLDLPREGKHLVCLPGTHSKWVSVSHGIASDFVTVLTGELFELLKTHSILRHSIGDVPKDNLAQNKAFIAAASDALTGKTNALTDLFSIRAKSLLQNISPEDGYAHLSGHLIGSEIREISSRMDLSSSALHLVGTGKLVALYKAVLDLAGHEAQSHNGEAAARNGLYIVARHIFNAQASKAAQ